MSITIREAKVSDIPHLAYVCLQATGGMFDAIYEGAIPGRETTLIVEHMFSRLNATSSFLNCRILEVDGVVVGGLHGYAATSSADNPGDPLVRRDRFHVLQPFIELPTPDDSYYISSIGFYPEHRGRGYGRQLMLEAEVIAHSLGLGATSLHVFEQNSAAVTLYRSMGYIEVGRRPVVPHPSIRYEGEVLLLRKSLNR